MVRSKSTSPKKLIEQNRRSNLRKSSVHIGRKKFKVSITTLRDIRRLQMNTSFLIPKLAFSRVVREILQDCTQGDDTFRLQSLALAALQEATEMYITHYFEDSYKCTFHSKRITLKPTDMQLVKNLRSRYEPY